MIFPRTQVPSLDFATLDGHWTLAEQKPDHFTMIVVYRGYHCGICAKYLQTLSGLSGRFTELGIDVVAVSTDTEERARKAREDWDLNGFTLGYGLSLKAAREWGLYISSARQPSEPERFIEPGLFWVRPNGELFYASVQNMPFGRPSLDEIATWAQKVIENDIPPRGVVQDVD